MSNEGLDIPVSTPGGDAAAATLERVAASLDKVARSAGSAGDRMASTSVSAAGLAEAAQAVGGAAGTLLRFGQAAYEAVGKLSTLAAEHERLSDQSRRLGLDFDDAAGAAGRFTDEVDVMNTAGAFAARGIRLTQTELNAMTRTAAATAQTLGITTADSLRRLEGALLSGRERALAPFGAELAATARHGYSAGEGIAAVVHSAEHLATAANDSATSFAALSDGFGDLAREGAAWATHMLGMPSIIADVSRAVGNLATQLAEVNRLETEQASRQAEGGRRARALSEFAAAQHRAGQLADTLGAPRSAIAVANVNGMTTEQIAAMTSRVSAVTTRLGATQRAGVDDIANRARNDLRPAPGSVVNLDTRAGGLDPFLASVTHTNHEIERASHGTVISVARDRAELVAAFHDASQELAASQAEAARSAAAAAAEAERARHTVGQRANASANAAASAQRHAEHRNGELLLAGFRDYGEQRRAAEHLLAEDIARDADVRQANERFSRDRQRAANDNHAAKSTRAGRFLESDVTGADNAGAFQGQALDKLGAVIAGGATGALGEQGASMADQLAGKEVARLDMLRDAHESYTGRLRELYAQQATAAQVAAEQSAAAFTSIGDAFGGAVLAVAEEGKTAKAASQEMLHGILSAVGKEASLKGSFYLAQSLGNLATGNLPGVGAAAAASVGFFGVAAAAGYAAHEAKPDAAPKGTSAGAGSQRAADVSPRRRDQGEGGVVVHLNFHAPVIGGAESTAAQVGTHLNRYLRAAGSR